jgi:Holliday junction resolvase RusA-like endonuclease
MKHVGTHSLLKWRPHAKQRPRATRTGHVYTPKATKDAEKNLKEQWLAQNAAEPLEGPLAVRLVLSDEAVSITVAEYGEPIESKKLRGDLDNYAKTVLDALNKVAWVDDRQIVHLEVVKR